MSAAVRAWYHPTSIGRSLILRPRVIGGAIASLIAALLMPSSWPLTVRSTLAWDAGGLVYLLFAFQLIASSKPEQMKAKAARRDDSRLLILTIILLAIIASFAAITGLINQAKAPTVDSTEKLLIALLAITTITISWSVTQVAFALHYAHAYYRPSEKDGILEGLRFTECKVPDYWDFLYFSTSIGAAAQTSDTSVVSTSLRRLVMLHSCLSFFFNTAVLALTVNIAASLAG